MYECVCVIIIIYLIIFIIKKFSYKNRELNDSTLLIRQRAVMSLCDYLHDPEHIAEALRCGKNMLFTSFAVCVLLQKEKEREVKCGKNKRKDLLFDVKQRQKKKGDHSKCFKVYQ